MLAFYSGITPVLIGSAPKAAIRFGGFQQIQNMLRKEDGTTTATRSLAAGLIAGASEAAIIVTPVERVKTRLIDSNERFVKGFQHIVRTQGIGGFYKGALPTILKQSSNQGLRFMFYGKYKDVMEQRGVKVQSYVALFGGMGAGLFSTMTNNPFDMVKTRMQGNNAHLYKGFFDCFVKVVKTEGVLALWSGVVPRLARVVPGQGVIFTSYETISQFVEGLVE